MQVRWISLLAIVAVAIGCDTNQQSITKTKGVNDATGPLVNQVTSGDSGLLSPDQGSSTKQQVDCAASEETSDGSPTVSLPVPRHDESGVRSEATLVDAAKDGFDSEILNVSAGKILNKIGEQIAKNDGTESLDSHVSEKFLTRGLRAENLKPTYTKDELQIFRGSLPESEYAGSVGLNKAIEELGSPFDGRQFEYKFKIDRITEQSADVASTSAIYLAMGTGKAGNIQQNARWNVNWDISAGMNAPKLLSIELERFEEGHVSSMIYSDCTESVFANVASFDKIRYGIDQRWGKIDAQMGFSFYGDYTTAIGDVNNDGLDDIYVCQPGGIENMLLRHNPDHTVSDISFGSSVNILNDTPTALIADFDNDGNQDLVIGTMLFCSIMQGDGNGSFRQAGEIQIPGALSISSCDYDNDGDLDLYFCRYSDSFRGTGADDPIFDSNHGLPNVLLRNDGGFRFTDVTVESGIDENNKKFSFSSVWEDYDNDGDLDLYVANDFGRNNLYQNNNGHFKDVASEAHVEDRAAGMGVSWADFNQDGQMDLYVSNMFSSAGGRIVDKPKVIKMAGQDSVEPLQRFAKGNTLFLNKGDGTFEDVSDQSDTTMGRWAWGGEFVDINNDGLPDIIVPNGFVTNTIQDDL